jgi:hypothetical protein
MGGKDNMENYKKAQEQGFNDLKAILEEKGITESLQRYIKRLEDVFAFYVVMDLNWPLILNQIRSKNNGDLESYLKSITLLVESYDED